MIPIRDENRTRRRPGVTWTLIALNAAVFVYELVLPQDALASLVTRWGVTPQVFWAWSGKSLPDILASSLVPCFSSMFIHAGWWHLLGNMWSLWLFGDNIEDRLGHTRFLFFYLLSGALAMLLHVVMHASSPIPAVGASGAIAGVLGAYFLLYPFTWLTVLIPIFFFPVFVKLPAAVYLLVWIASQLLGGYGALASGGTGGIAFWAHIGGFASGIYLIRRWKIRRR